MTAKRKTTLIVYAPALAGDDSRPLTVVHGMERAFPGLRLEWTTSLDGQRTRLANRDAWLVQQSMDRDFPLLHNCEERAYVSVYGIEAAAAYSPGGQAQLEVHAKLPLSPEGIAASVDVLESVAEAARAYWGHATPSRASVDIARQTKNRPDDPEPPPHGLPMIRSPGALRSPEIPHRLGWLNYWSDAAARALGFPDPALDTELLSRSRRTPASGWVVQLTEAPLDLDDPTHLDALQRAYARFPEIGGRAAP